MVLTRRQSAAAAAVDGETSIPDASAIVGESSAPLQPGSVSSYANHSPISDSKENTDGIADAADTSVDRAGDNDVQRFSPLANTLSNPSVSSPGSLPTAPAQNPKPKIEPYRAQRREFIARATIGLMLTVFFCVVIRGGHMWVGLAIVFMEGGMFNEVLRLGFPVAQSRRIPLWRTTGWYFFVSLIFLLYGKIVLSHFYDQNLHISRSPAFKYALEHHSFISFCMYCAGLVGFVLSLRPHSYHFQFTYFGRALVALSLVVVQSHFMILNISLGLIWFVLPCWLIVVNDSFGYFCGRLFGRHSLLALSPKKTWEGYIGAAVFTMAAAYFLSDFLSSYPSLVCPRYDFNDCYLWCPPLSCDPIPQPFIKKIAHIATLPFIGAVRISYRPIQLHAVALGIFASSIAPFGGFFASGAKRAFGVKDFGRLLPGHGGVTDRVDCQLLMAVFTYVYVINFVKVNFVGSPDVGKVLSFVSELSTAEQVDLFTELYVRLQRRGVDGLLANLSNVTRR